MPIPVSGQVGPQGLGDGVSTQPFRQGRTAETIVSELHGRFYEQVSRNSLFATGMTVTSISNVTFTTGTLGATCTPIIGVWNPGTSQVNVVVLQAILQIALTALQNTGGGPFVWAASVGNNAISTGLTPINRRTLQTGASGVKGFAGTALTGLTNNLVVLHAAGVAGGNLYNIATLSTAAGFTTPMIPSVENIDGGFVVPPGGVLALLATTTPVAQSASSALLWEEVAL